MDTSSVSWMGIVLLGLIFVLAIAASSRRRLRFVSATGFVVVLILMFKILPAWTALSFAWAQDAQRNSQLPATPEPYVLAQNAPERRVSFSSPEAAYAAARKAADEAFAKARADIRLVSGEPTAARPEAKAAVTVTSESNEDRKEVVQETKSASPAPLAEGVKETKAPLDVKVVKKISTVPALAGPQEKVRTDVGVQHPEALPAAREPAGEPKQSGPELNFYLRKDATGQSVLYLNDKLVTDALLDSKVSQDPVTRDKQQVLLAADRGIPYRDVIEVINRLAGKGWHKVSLKTIAHGDVRQTAPAATSPRAERKPAEPEPLPCNTARRRWNLEVFPYPIRLKLPGSAVAVGHIETLRHEVEPSYHVRRAAKPITLDGKLNEWTTTPAIRLDADNFVRGGRRDSAQDVSGRLQMQWDDRGLNFAVDATDNFVNQPNPIWSDWENDSCQFMFDTLLNGPSGSFDDQDLSYCVSRREANRAVLSHYRMRGSDREVHDLLPVQTAAFSQTPQGYVYEWSVPWEQLAPVSPFVLGSSGFSFTINDNDGSGFEGALAWTGGAIYGLDAGQLGRIDFDNAVGTRDAKLELLPEHGPQFRYYLQGGLKLPDSGPNQATLLVRPKQETDVAARILIYRLNSLEPFAKGLPQAVRCGGRLGTGVFSWDLTPLGTRLPAGETVKIAYETSLLPQEQPTMVPYRVVGSGGFVAQSAPGAPSYGMPGWGPSQPPQNSYAQPPQNTYVRAPGSATAMRAYQRTSGGIGVGPLEVAVLIAALLIIVSLRWGLAHVVTLGGIAAGLFAVAVVLFVVAGYFFVAAPSVQVAQRQPAPAAYPTAAEQAVYEQPIAEQPVPEHAHGEAVPVMDSTADSSDGSTATPRPRTSVTWRPSWIDTLPTLQGTVYQVAVSGPWSTDSECEIAIQKRIKGMADSYIDKYLGEGASASLNLDAAQLTQLLRTEKYTTTLKTSVGPMQQSYALLSFTDSVRQNFYQLWRNQLVQQRLIAFGSATGAVVLMLALARFFLRRGIEAPPLASANAA